MKGYKKILIICSLIVLVAMLGVSVSYAWFASFKETGDMSFEILQIDSIVNLYQGNDSNDNGVLDLLDEDNKYLSMKDSSAIDYNTYVTYGEYYYIEKYDFSFKDSKYALSKDSSANLLNTITLNNMSPSKIYTIKFEAINYSTFENNMYFEFLALDSNNAISLDFLKQFEVRFGAIKNTAQNVTESDAITYEFTEWVPFLSADETSFTGLKMNSSAYTLPINNTYMNDGKSHHGKIDFWLQIRINKDAEITNADIFTLPEFRITFEIPESATE